MSKKSEDAAKLMAELAKLMTEQEITREQEKAKLAELMDEMDKLVKRGGRNGKQGQ